LSTASPGRAAEHLTLAEIKPALGINLWGSSNGTKALLPTLLRQREGCIVNISSVFGLVAVPAESVQKCGRFEVRPPPVPIRSRGTG
jgi:NADP-dependent 3-hydroxy acid dehydrogenase YdfG